MECRECDLNIYSTPTCIPGSGNKKAKVMIINSYAGDADESQGEAVPSQQLVKFIGDMGIKDYYYTNAIKCRCPKGTKYKVSETKKCSKLYLMKEIEEVDPQYVLLIGAQALKATIDGNITAICGVPIERDGRTWMATLNPGVIFHDPAKADTVYRAFGNFRNLVQGEKMGLPELNIKLIKNMVQAREAIRYLKDKGIKDVSYDIESSGLNRFEDSITLFGFGCDTVQFIVPLEVKYSPLRGKPIAQRKIMRYIMKELNRVTRNRIAGNGKFDDLFLQVHFGYKPDITFDVVLASHCLNENTPNGVKENAIAECGALEWDVNISLKKGNLKNLKDYDDYLTYLGYDVYFEYSLFKVFNKRLKQDKATRKIFNHIYMPGAKAYEIVESNGVYIYPEQFKEVRKYLMGQLEGVLSRMKKVLRKSKITDEINWSSPAQIKKLLYTDLGLPVVERTESGEPSTSEATLKRLKDKHPIIPLILEYRGIAIQITHFVDGWINRMHNGRLYPHFKMNGTVTGRTSCTDPNLQQVPRDPRIRTLVGAPANKRAFIEIDFSQAELRIATIISGDPTMARIYNTGGDIHTHTYEMISGEKISDDKYERKEQRKKAKAVNFGFVYGMGWKKFKDYARDTYGVTLTEKEAKEWRERFFQTYSKLPEWHSRQRKIVKAMGQVRSPIGRLRRLPDIYSSDPSKRAEAERQSINSPVQGFGSDLTILGMSEILGTSLTRDPKYDLDQSRFIVVGTVHDATLFEVDYDYLEEFIPKAKHVLEEAKALTEIFHFHSPIPLIADVALGSSWGAGKELHMEPGDDKTWREEVHEFLRSVGQE